MLAGELKALSQQYDDTINDDTINREFTEMRKALVVGVDFYKNTNNLFGCVNDAYSVKSVLDRHSDGTINFGVNLRVAGGAILHGVDRQLRDAWLRRLGRRFRAQPLHGRGGGRPGVPRRPPG